MISSPLLYCIVYPALCGVLLLVVGNRIKWLREFLLVLASGINGYMAWALFQKSGESVAVALPWAGFGLDFTLRLQHFGGFILLAGAGFGVLISLYSAVFMREHRHANQFYAYFLFSLAQTNGVALADNLVMLLFFWESLLVTLFGMIAIGREDAWKTAVKALVLVGISDVCMMVGMALVGSLRGTLSLNVLTQQGVALDGLGGLAFILLVLGAVSKAGAIPFHTWIPDAAEDAPLPFMALVPAALEKLLGIYFLARICLDIFKLPSAPDNWACHFLMILGAVTILIAVMMALIQKDYKRLLAYHAISQVGYMILGIGTAVYAGIIGGIFHMLNHALYKSCLFLSGGSVERQAGTTDLKKLGGLKAQMPLTFICFAVAAASISGVPPFNGFYSKELVYDGALSRHVLYYVAAVLGSFLTAASFLKLGHAVYFGKLAEENKKVKEAPAAMLIPMIVIAGLCVLFGPWNELPLKTFIYPILEKAGVEYHTCHGPIPHQMMLVAGTLIALVLAALNHRYGVKRTGVGVGASEHIHHAPVLGWFYDKAEKRWFDPYEVGMKVLRGGSYALFYLDRFICWLSDGLAAGLTYLASAIIRWSHNGSCSRYVLWALAGAAILIWYVMKSA
ncbi:MAG: proton-conducting transporter membrane subunit [Verrucomicrobiae bacterium]|nr:proton-conducting transporter membrane subunit [Verrucomicrobiae bacterium]